MKRCGICKRRTFDYRWYNRTPWVPLWLRGRMDCGSDCWRCIADIENNA